MTALDQLEPDPGAAAGPHRLDTAVWASLTGPHAHLAEGSGPVRRYPQDMSPFGALDPAADPTAWAELATQIGPGGSITRALPASVARAERLPDGWQVTWRIAGVQMIATEAFESGPDPEAVVLGADDVPEMLDLVRRTEPGPFLPSTHRLGTYLGIRRAGALVAMAGERMHPPGYTEISAVCTDPAFRGQGLAARLIRAVAHGIRERGDTPFLHTSAQNAPAIRLYDALGFDLRMQVEFVTVSAPLAF